MARITMRNPRGSTVEEVFSVFLAAAAARGVKEKTLETYRQHFHSIGKRLDAALPMKELDKSHLNEMILRMRDEGLSDCSINSYTRTLKVFFSWCRGEGYSSLDIKLYKAAETVKEVYSDEELLRLLDKPKATCSFCEYRNWTIINFLLNSGCRAATVRCIQIQDVDLPRRQITLRHTKNGRVQIIPLCGVMIPILQDYMAIRGGSAQDHLFCNEYGDMLTENALRQAIAKYNRSRGVERTSLHAFRHTFARKYLVDCGGDAFMLQKLMGHSTLAMTKHYCNIFNNDVVQVHDQFSPLAQIKRSNSPKIKR